MVLNIIGGVCLVIILVFAIAFVIVCVNKMDSNKGEDGFNRYNSSLGVRCDAKDVCDFRHTTTCDRCQHNHGMKPFKSSFVPRNN